MLWTIGIAGAIAGALVSGIVFYSIGSARVSKCELSAQRDRAALAERTTEIVNKAQRAAETALTTLEQERRKHRVHTEKLRAQLRELRPIVVSPEHRVLINEAVAGPNHVPETSSDASDRPAAAPASQPALDRLDEWAVVAAESYNACRAQIRELKNWTEATFGPLPEQTEQDQRKEHE